MLKKRQNMARTWFMKETFGYGYDGWNTHIMMNYSYLYNVRMKRQALTETERRSFWLGLKPYDNVLSLYSSYWWVWTHQNIDSSVWWV